MTATNQNAVSITYDLADRKYQETLSDGIVATYAYDNANELTSITYMNGTANVGTLTFSYDADGRGLEPGRDAVPGGPAIRQCAAD